MALRVRRLGRKLTRIYDDALRPHGVTIAQFNLLVAIGVSAPISPGVLGSAMELEKSTLSRNVAKLVARELVRSAVSTSGGLNLSLTAKGGRLLAKARPDWEAAQRQARRLMNSKLASAVGSLPPRQR